MRKLYIILLLVASLTLLCVCGCSKTDIGSINDTSIETDSDVAGTSNVLEQGNSTFTETKTQVKYLSFEECLSAATHVVSATFTGEYEAHGMYKDLIFTSVKQYKGETLTGNFHLRVCDQIVNVVGTDIGYSSSANDYIAGETYLLVIEKHVSVYYPYDVYLTLGNIRITENDSVMYDGAKIEKHSSNLQTSSSIGIVDYIEEYVSKSVDTSTVQGIDYIRGTTLKTIVDESTIIAIVTPTEYIGGSDNNNTSRYSCSVDEVIKGSLSDDVIKVIFTADSVSVGESYVVMLEEMGTYYILSSQNSVYDAANSSVVQQVRSNLYTE